MIRYVKGTYGMAVNGGIVVETGSGIGLEIFLPMNSPIYKYDDHKDFSCIVRGVGG